MPKQLLTASAVLFAILILLSFSKFVIFCLGVVLGGASVLLLKEPVTHLKTKLKIWRKK